MNNREDSSKNPANISLDSRDTRRLMAPLVFLLLEGSVLLSGLVLFAGLAAEGPERLTMLLFLPFILLTGLLMERTNRRYGQKTAFFTGAAAVGATAYGVVAGVDNTGFLVWETALGYVFVARFGLWLADSVSPEERFRGYFLWECIAVPVLVIIGFRHSTDSSLVLAAVVSYLFLRGFSLAYAQRIASGVWSFRMRGALILIGIAAVLLPLVLAFPTVAGFIGYIGVPILMLLDWLGKRIHFHRPPQAGPESQFDPVKDGRQKLPWEQTAVHTQIPGAVWAGILVLIGLVLLVVLYKNRSERVTAPATVPVQIRRSRAVGSGPRRLRYFSAAKGIRRIYQGLLRGMEEKGLPIRAQETPREYTRRLRQQLPAGFEKGRELDVLVERYEDVRYGEREEGSNEADRLTGDQAKLLVERVLAAFSTKVNGKDRRKS